MYSVNFIAKIKMDGFVKKIFFCFVLGAVLFSTVFGQASQNTKNSADQSLRSSGRVNPSSLGMEMDIPLSAYPGRGLNLPLGLNYSSKVWRFEEFASILQNNGTTNTYVKPKYSENAASGWTSSLSQPYIEYTGDIVAFDDYGRPLQEVFGPGQTTPPGNHYIRRITIYLPGGSSHELRADDEVHSMSNTQTSPPASVWEGDFYATDGSGLKYHQNSSAGTFRLYMADGSFYDFNSSLENKSSSDPISVRRANRLTDINGNFVQFNAPTTAYPNGSWSDELGRTFPVMIPSETPSMPANQSILNQTFTLPGMSQGYTLRWKKLQGSSAETSGFTDFNTQILKYAGHISGFGSPSTTYTPSLFYDATQMSPCSQDKLMVLVGSTSKFNPVVLTEIVLPNGASYRFSYNEYGEMERIYYPTGGREEITYNKVASLAELSAPYQMSNRGATTRKIYESNNDSTADTWTYTAQSSANNFLSSTIAPDGTQTDRFMHRGVPPPSCIQQNSQGQAENAYGTHWGYDNILAGMPYEERSFSSDGQLKQRSLTRWTATNTTAILTGSPQRYVQRNARVLSTESIIYEGDAGLSTSATMEYDTDVDNFGSPQNVTKTKQYDYKVVSGGSTFTPNQTPPTDVVSIPDPTIGANLLRISETVYLQNDVNYTSVKSYYLANNLVKLSTATKIRNANNQVIAHTEIRYDETNYGSGGYRGQVTKLRRWLDTNNSWLEMRSKYDTYGNMIESIDAKGNVKVTEYSATYNYAYPTRIIKPAPDLSGATGSQTTFQTTTVYNPTTGLPASVTDANGQISTFEYNDTLLRSTKAIMPNGHQTITEYGAGTTEATRFVKVITQIDTEKWKEGYSWYDGLGRTIKTQSIDASGDVFTETEYDNMSRAKRATNPYRTGETKLWTENTFDTAGRSWKITTPDGAFVETTYGLATIGSHLGTVTIVTDQAGRMRRSITNALGQFSRVDEPNSSNQLGAINSPNQDTSYVYDTLDNLIQVNQGAQQRNFQYDSLSRLKSATNPESGITSYEYDNNGNLISKADARNLTTTYIYDALNRVTARNYNDGVTPNVTYKYDNLTNAKGKLIEVDNGISKTKCLSFDSMGRVTSSQQITDGTTYNPMTYTYNLSGALIEETYPSGRIVKNTLDADGDLAQVESAKTQNGSLKVYANNFTYTAAGAVSSMRLGNGRWELTQFNSRLQPTQIALGTAQNATNLLKLDYEYGTLNLGTGQPIAGTNNGNVSKQTITVQNTATATGFSATQYYSYDSLNRIKIASENITPNGSATVQTWQQTFQYDRYGNRNFDEANTTTLPKNCGGQVCPNDRKILNPSISITSNRINQDQDGDQINDYVFDLAGNTTKEASGNSFTYNAENKQIKVVNPSSQIVGEYFYDGEGNRIKKYVPSTQETTVFVYDALGKMVAEYSTITEPPATAKVSYMTNDRLGSPRVITNEIGQVTSRRDFMPFGEEIYSSQRTANLGYTADNIRRKFNSYEKDNESGLDFAQARYHNSVLGRFQSPDNFLNDTQIVEPASWNLYVFVRNNPLNLTDPDGEKVYVGGLDPKERDKVIARMNATYGCNGCVSVDSDGYLTVDTSNLSKDVKDATSWLTEAITTTSWYGEVQVSNNDPDVAFGQGRPAKGSVPCEDQSKCKKRNADLIVLDFGDDQWVSGNKEASAAFLNTVLAHEIAHFRLNPGKITNDPADTNKTGLVVDAINKILNARGLPLRAKYGSSKTGDYWFTIQHGEADGNKTNDDGGIKVKVTDSAKVITWLKRNVGGKGIN